MKRTNAVGMLRSLRRAAALRLALAAVLALMPGAPGVGVISVQAQTAPSLVNFQGRLTDALDNPITGTRDFRFELWPTATGGTTPLWSEDQAGVAVINGVLAVRLGSTTPIPAAAFAGGDAYLQIIVGGTPLTPRERLVSAPYALNAQLLQGREPGRFVSTDTAAQSIAGAKVFTGQLTVPAPTLFAGAGGDPAGSPGALYFNSTTGKLRLHIGSGFVDVATGTTGGTLSAAGLTPGTFGAGVFLPAAQVLPGALDTGVTAPASVAKAGDAMTGQLTLAGSTLTVTGDAVSVGGSTLAVAGGRLGVGTSTPGAHLDVRGNILTGGDSFGLGSAATGGNQHLNLFAAGPGGAVRLHTGVSTVGDTGFSGGTLRMSVESAGGFTRAGIGDAAGGPGAALHVATADTDDVLFALESNGALTADYLQIRSNGSSVGDVVSVKSDGDTGIGTTSPSGRLHVKGGDVFVGDHAAPHPDDTTASEDLLVAGNIIVDGKIVQHGGAGSESTFDTLGVATKTISGQLFKVGAATMTVTQSGRVGIGTADPDVPLHVKGDNLSAYLEAANAGSGGIAAMSLLSTRHFALQSTGGAGGRFQIRDNSANAERLAIDATGNVGIGTTAPAARLQVVGGDVLIGSPTLHDTTADEDLLVKGNLIVDGRVVQHQGTDATIETLVVEGTATVKGDAFSVGASTLVATGGRVGIGTSSPQSRLHVEQPGVGATALRIDSDVTDPAFRWIDLRRASDGLSFMRFYFQPGIGNVIETDGGIATTRLKSGTFQVTDNADANILRATQSTAWSDSVNTTFLQLGSAGYPHTVLQTSGANGRLQMKFTNVQLTTSNPQFATTPPATMLDVDGDAQFGSGATKSTFTASGALRFPASYSPTLAEHAATRAYVDSTVAASGGGWTDGGTSLRLTDGGDNVVIQSTLTVSGDAFSVGGSTLAVAGGNVGIGTAAANDRLEVAGTQRLTSGGMLRGFSGATELWRVMGPETGEFRIASMDASRDLRLSTRDSGGTDRIGLTLKAGQASGATGNLGVGTTSPEDKLHIAGNIRLQDDGAIQFGATGANQPKIVDAGNQNLHLFAAPTFATPELEINGNSTFVLRSDSGDGSNAVGFLFDTRNSMTATGAKLLEVRESGSPRLTLDHDGNVGIGIATPAAALHVSSAATLTTTPILIVSTGTAAGQELLWVQRDGKLGVRTGAPAVGLHAVDGSGNVDGVFNANAVIEDRATTPVLILKNSNPAPNRSARLQFMSNLGVGGPNWHLGTDMDGSGSDNFFIGSLPLGSGRAVVIEGTQSRVGLNTNNPASAQLHIAKNVGGTGGQHLILTDTSAGADIKHAYLVMSGGNLSVGKITDDFATPAEHLRLTTEGRLGVGAAAPQARLEVKPTAADGYSVWISSQDSSAVLRVDKSGDVLVGSPTVHDTTAAPDLLVQGNLIVDGRVVQHQGTDSALESLIVEGTATVKGNAFSVGGSTLAVAGGSVGIGTASPVARMHVAGNDGNMLIAAFGNDADQVKTSIKGDFGNQFGGLYWGYGQSATHGFAFDYSGNPFIGDGGGSATRLFIDKTTGDVGIGTASPTSAAGAAPAVQIFGATPGLVTKLSAEDKQLAFINATNGSYIDSTGAASTGNNDLIFRVSGAAGAHTFTERLRVAASGQVHFGSVGAGSTARFYSSAAAGSGAYGYLSADDTTLGRLNLVGGQGSASTVNELAISAITQPGVDDTYDLGVTGARWRSLRVGTNDSSFAGDVGIGTTSPATIESQTLAGGERVLHVDNSVGSFLVARAPNVHLELVDSNAAADLKRFSINHDAGRVDLRLVSDNGTAVQKYLMSMDMASGNVGIGTSGPAERLDVRGGDVALSDADVAHGITSVTSTNAYGLLDVDDGLEGGLRAWGLSDAAGRQPLRMLGVFGPTDPTDTVPAIELTGRKGDGLGGVAALANSETVLQVTNLTTPLVSVLGSGNVGIGSASPEDRLQVNGSVQVGDMAAPGKLYSVVGGGPDYNLEVGVNRANENATVPQVWSEWQTASGGASWGLKYRSAGDTGTASTRLAVDADSGQVAIGASPSAAGRLVVDNTGSQTALTAIQRTSGEVGLVVNHTVDTGATAIASFQRNGTEVVKVQADGNVGIGTSSPDDKLHVVGQVRIDNDTNTTNKGCLRYNGGTNQLEWSNDCSTFQGFAASSGGGWTDAGTTLSNTTLTDKVGVGTAAPDELLHVSGGVLASYPKPGAADSSSLLLSNNQDATIRVRHNAGLSRIYTDAGQKLSLATNGQNDRIYLASDGKIGLGNTSPASDVDMDNGDAVNTWLRLGGEAATVSKYVGLESGGSGFGASSGFSGVEFGGPGSASEGYLAFHTHDVGTSSGERMRIDKSGNVGIGTTGMTEKLHVWGNARFGDSAVASTYIGTSLADTGNFVIFHNGVSGKQASLGQAVPSIAGVGDDLIFSTYNSGWAEKMRLTNGGNVGIGTPSPGALLDVSGDGKTILIPRKSDAGDPASPANGMMYYNANTNRFRCYQGGAWQDCVAAGTSQWITSGSDVYYSAGKVGIGITSPAGQLHIAKDSDAYIYISGANTGEGRLIGRASAGTHASPTNVGDGKELFKIWAEGYSGATGFWQTSGLDFEVDGAVTDNQRPPSRIVFNTNVANGAVAERMRLDRLGNLGIGTTSSGVRLHVKGSGTDQVKIESDGTVAGLVLTTTAGQLAELQGTNGDVQLNASLAGADIKLITQGIATQGITIQDGGNVGIGTTGPSGRLDVRGGNIALQESQVIGSGLGYGCSGCAQAGTIKLYDAGTGDLEIQSGTAYDLALNPNGGNVGVGTTAPTYKLDAQANTASAATLLRAINTGAGEGQAQFESASTFQMFIKSGNGPRIVFDNTEGGSTDFTIAADGVSTPNKLSVGGSLHITSAGNIGIGTTGPNAKLDIQSGSLDAPPLQVQRGYDGGRIRIQYAAATDGYGEIGQTYFAAGKTNLWMGSNLNTFGAAHEAPTQGNASAASILTRWNSINDNWSVQRIAPGGGTSASTLLYVGGDSKVGIGTTSPSGTLDVRGGAASSGAGVPIILSAQQGAASSNGGNVILNSGPNGSGASNGYIAFGTGSSFTGDELTTERMRINRDGNVGIGTTGPTAHLQLGPTEVAGDTSYSVSGNGQGLLLKFRESASAVRFADIAALGVVAGGGSAIRFFTNSADSAVERMRIIPGGNVGIGTTAPGGRIHSVSDSASYPGGWFSMTTPGNSGIHPLIAQGDGWSGDVVRIFDSDGSCLLGPQASQLTIGCSSDARLKSNIVPAPTQLRYLTGIPIKEFTVKASGERRIGTIAQELLADPDYAELVSMGSDGFYVVKEISSWKLLKGIQELEARTRRIEERGQGTVAIAAGVNASPAEPGDGKIEDAPDRLPRIRGAVTKEGGGSKSVSDDGLVAELTEAVRELKLANDALHARLNRLERKPQ
ncbi:MAG: tail fiber domain-containing protein [Elusimicrobia bacterium]|nr:tail fiber domain-containing protein [Elusimicrobiota bacterium]